MGFSIAVLDVRCYNGFGQLASVNRDMVVTRYRYRPDGLRHAQTTRDRTGARHTTVYHWDGQNLVRESNGEGGVKATYLRGAGLIAQVIDLSLFYYLLNAHGDVIQRIAGNKQAAPRYEYDAFGNLREKAGYNPDKDPNPLRYCGEYWDSDTQELYLRARTYQPKNGRFTSEDPAKDGGNWYSYCGANPITRSDPSGLASVPMWDFGEPGGYIPPKKPKPNPSGYIPVADLNRPTNGSGVKPPTSTPSGGGMQGRPGQYSNELPTSTNPRSSHNPNSYFANPDSRYNMRDALGAAITGLQNSAMGAVMGVYNFFTNTDEKAVWEGGFITFYKGVPVIKVGTDRSFSFGVIFLGSSRTEEGEEIVEEDIKILQHEYGHISQLAQLGPAKYIFGIVIPSASNSGVADYYGQPWEVTADVYGGVDSASNANGHQNTDEEIAIGFRYLEMLLNHSLWAFSMML